MKLASIVPLAFGDTAPVTADREDGDFSDRTLHSVYGNKASTGLVTNSAFENIFRSTTIQARSQARRVILRGSAQAALACSSCRRCAAQLNRRPAARLSSCHSAARASSSKGRLTARTPWQEHCIFERPYVRASAWAARDFLGDHQRGHGGTDRPRKTLAGCFEKRPR